MKKKPSSHHRPPEEPTPRDSLLGLARHDLPCYILAHFPAFELARHLELIVAKLEANRITATPRYSDAGGWAPQFAQFGGHAVMVFDCDLEKATALLADE